MAQIKNARLNRMVRNFCRHIHEMYLPAMNTLPPRKGEHDGFGMVYLVAPNGQTVFEVSCEYGAETWALAVVNTPFRHVAALSDGCTLDRVDLGDTTSVDAFLDEARRSQLWKGEPPRDSWDSR